MLKKAGNSQTKNGNFIAKGGVRQRIYKILFYEWKSWSEVAERFKNEKNLDEIEAELKAEIWKCEGERGKVTVGKKRAHTAAVKKYQQYIAYKKEKQNEKRRRQREAKRKEQELFGGTVPRRKTYRRKRAKILTEFEKAHHIGPYAKPGGYFGREFSNLVKNGYLEKYPKEAKYRATLKALLDFLDSTPLEDIIKGINLTLGELSDEKKVRTAVKKAIKDSGFPQKIIRDELKEWKTSHYYTQISEVKKQYTSFRKYLPQLLNSFDGDLRQTIRIPTMGEDLIDLLSELQKENLRLQFSTGGESGVPGWGDFAQAFPSTHKKLTEKPELSEQFANEICAELEMFWLERVYCSHVKDGQERVSRTKALKKTRKGEAKIRNLKKSVREIIRVASTWEHHSFISDLENIYKCGPGLHTYNARKVLNSQFIQ